MKSFIHEISFFADHPFRTKIEDDIEGRSEKGKKLSN
jgi:hypothetical protein